MSTFSSTLAEMEQRSTRRRFVQNPYPSIGIPALLTLPQSDSVIKVWTEPACSSVSWSRSFAIRFMAPLFVTRWNFLPPGEAAFCLSISSYGATQSSLFAEPLVSIIGTNPSNCS